MTLKLKFIVFIALIHSVAMGLSFLILKDNKPFFIASELLILVSLVISWSLYQDLIAPLQRLMTGVNAIKDRDFNVKFIKTNEVETDTLIEVYNAMIDQLRTERTHQEAQHFFLQKLVTTSPTGILILDFDHKIADLNPKCAEILNLSKEDIIGKFVYDFDNALLKTIAELETGASKTINLNSAKTFKCAKSHFIDRGFPRYFIMIEELTAEILAAEKKAYGKVIRLMAHEVNNSIGAVNSILDTTIQLNEASESTNEALQIAYERNEHLSQFMRNFADVIRLPEPRMESINLNELVTKTAHLMRFKAQENEIVFNLELANLASKGPLSIKADFNQMEQVLINIIKNAIEAIGKDGEITFRTTSNPLQLFIEDTGHGISKDVENQLFTPFFTTKTYGQGVGLTLIREILTVHGFNFALYTEGSSKTVFKIQF